MEAKLSRLETLWKNIWAAEVRTIDETDNDICDAKAQGVLDEAVGVVKSMQFMVDAAKKHGCSNRKIAHQHCTNVGITWISVMRVFVQHERPGQTIGSDHSIGSIQHLTWRRA